MKAIFEIETSNKVAATIEKNNVLAQLVFIETETYFISPFGVSQENNEVEG